MSETAEKRQRFEMLMEQARVPQDVVGSFFVDGYIDKVETSHKNKEWTLYIGKSSIVPREVYVSFCKLIRDKFAHIAAIRFILRYTDQVTAESIAHEYWSMFVEWVQREETSVNGWMNKAHIEVQGNVLTLVMLDSMGLEMAKKKISGSGFKPITIRILALISRFAIARMRSLKKKSRNLSSRLKKKIKWLRKK